MKLLFVSGGTIVGTSSAIADETHDAMTRNSHLQNVLDTTIVYKAGDYTFDESLTQTEYTSDIVLLRSPKGATFFRKLFS
jgi:hypothetical protein